MRSAARLFAVRWMLPVALVAVLALIVWLAGGFRTAAATAGPTADFEETLQLRRWTVQIHAGVPLTDVDEDGIETDPAFRVRAKVELTDDTSVSSFPDLIKVQVPNGPQTESRRIVGNRSDAFDPDLSREQVWDFGWSGRQAPEQVVIIVSDEQPSEGYIFADEWSVGDPVGVITAPVTDERSHG